MNNHKFADIFPMMNEEEFKQLKQDIEENGLIEPVVIYETQILDGRNRAKACNELGIEFATENYEGDDALLYVISKNIKRRHLNPSQIGVIAERILPYFEDRAKESQGTRSDLTSVTRVTEVKRATEEAGKTLGVSGRTIDRVKEIRKKDPEKLLDIMKGKAKVGTVLREIHLQEQREEIKNMEPSKALLGVYDVIVIDPPWDYGTNEAYDADSFRGTTPYPTMTQEQLLDLKLPTSLSCVMWLWTTNKFLHDSFHLLEKWGFEAKSVLTWDKQHFGTGRWLRSQTEHCILAIKGKPYFNNTKFGTLISEKRTTHSTKPESFYDMVDEICAGRKLDYFNKDRKRDGWDSYGN